jgi:CheY-like chemotaxis protein
MELHPAPILLTQLGSFVESSFGPLAQQKGLEFVVDIADGLPAAIVTDEQRLQQVVKNLLSNAIKFTESGRVQLSVFAAPKDLWHSVPTLDNAETVVALSVTDTGVGVPAEKLGLIFEEFQQGDGTTSRKYGGTGLGLSISRNITRLLGGAIAVQSAEGIGSTFTIYVPADFPFDMVDTAESSGLPPGPVRLPKVPMLSRAVRAPIELGADDPLRGSTVLIIDDDVRNVFALTSALEMHGMSVLYADNGRAGIELLEEHGSTIDLMLMDVMMPEMDGNETTAEIRQKNGFAELPILFLTAKAMPGDRDKSLMAGASDYITKPVDLDKLLTVMRSWLVDHTEPAGTELTGR